MAYKHKNRNEIKGGMLMIHEHPVYDTDPHFSIDPNTRGITYTSSEKLILIQGDHNSQVYTFEIPRYIDGHDMMSCNLVQVHYINIDGSNSKNRSNGVYEVLDMQLDPEDENTCVFSWLISANATLFVGRLGFAIRFSCMEEDEPTYVWNTSVHDGVTIATGYNNSNVVVEQYADVLESWYWEFKDVTSTGVNVIEIARDDSIAKIETAKEESITVLGQFGGIAVSETEPESENVDVWFNRTDSTLRIRNSETGEFEALTTIKGEKGDPGEDGKDGEITNITQDTGDSETLVMSQKAVTFQINGLGEGLNYYSSQLSNLDSQVSNHDYSISDHETRIYNLEGYTSIITGNSNGITDLQNTLHYYEDVESKVYDHETRITDLESNSGGSSSNSCAYVTTYTGNNGEEVTFTLPFNPALLIITDTGYKTDGSMDTPLMKDAYIHYGGSYVEVSDVNGNDHKMTVGRSVEHGSRSTQITLTKYADEQAVGTYYNGYNVEYGVVAIGPLN